MHPWHDVPLGKGPGNRFTAVVETPRDSHVQYGLDLPTGLLRVKRVLSSAVQYPANYGFVPRTLAEDEEPLDVLVIGQDPIHPLSLVRARAIGLLRMIQSGRRNEKILAVHIDDPAVESYRECWQLPAYQLAEIEKFFRDSRAPEEVAVGTFGFGDAREAMQHLADLASAYAAHVEHGRSTA